MERLKEMLINQRQEIFERFLRTDSGWRTLAERDSELEEEAQKADLSRLFDQLESREQGQLEEIELALAKMVTGGYGNCESCQRPISMKRMEALPAARLCRQCAAKYEEKQRKLPRASEVTVSPKPRGEYRNLSDEELREAIWDYLRGDDRIDLDELEIVCKNGVISLEGVIPSKSEHQILMRTLTDVMGFTAIIDHLQINELIWEREDRTPGTVVAPLERTEGLPMDENRFSEDVFETEEEGASYIAPDRPPAERE